MLCGSCAAQIRSMCSGSQDACCQPSVLAPAPARREAAEEAERRRLVALERQRLEELRRLEVIGAASLVAAFGHFTAFNYKPTNCFVHHIQEERRLRREAKRRWAMQRLYLARWQAETRRYGKQHLLASWLLTAVLQRS